MASTAKGQENMIKTYLGRWKFGKLVDSFLEKRLLPELYKRGKKYADIRDKIIKKDFTLEEFTTYVVPDFRGGKITLSLPEDNFEMTSFYKAAFNPGKKREIAKDFDVSNFLHARNMPVPAAVYKTKNFSATELIEGRQLHQIIELWNEDSLTYGDLSKKISGSLKRNVLKKTINTIFKYHKLPVDDVKVKRSLRVIGLDDFYGIHRFINDVNHNQKPNGLVKELKRNWKTSIDDYLSEEPVGILHNDLHNGNIIVSEKAGYLQLIDWGDATFGPIQYDVVRALMSQGFFDETFLKDLKAREDVLYSKPDNPIKNIRNLDVYKKELSQIISKSKLQENGYDRNKFYSAVNRAHASIRLRLAKSVYGHMQKIKSNEIFRNEVTREENEILEGFASYHYTHALMALEREGLDQIVEDLEILVEQSGVGRKEDRWMEDFISKYDADVSAWSRVQAIEKRVGLVEQEKRIQDKDIKRIQWKRRVKNSIGALATTAVLSVGGLYAYPTIIAPLMEQEAAEQFVSETYKIPREILLSNQGKEIVIPEIILNELHPKKVGSKIQEFTKSFQKKATKIFEEVHPMFTQLMQPRPKEIKECLMGNAGDCSDLTYFHPSQANYNDSAVLEVSFMNKIDELIFGIPGITTGLIVSQFHSQYRDKFHNVGLKEKRLELVADRLNEMFPSNFDFVMMASKFRQIYNEENNMGDAYRVYFCGNDADEVLDPKEIVNIIANRDTRNVPNELKNCYLAAATAHWFFLKENGLEDYDTLLRSEDKSFMLYLDDEDVSREIEETEFGLINVQNQYNECKTRIFEGMAVMSEMEMQQVEKAYENLRHNILTRSKFATKLDGPKQSYNSIIESYEQVIGDLLKQGNYDEAHHLLTEAKSKLKPLRKQIIPIEFARGQFVYESMQNNTESSDLSLKFYESMKPCFKEEQSFNTFLNELKTKEALTQEISQRGIGSK